MHDVDTFDGGTAFSYVGQQNVIQEDATKADRQEHVGRNQAEGQHTGHRPAIQSQTRHDKQQRRHQQRDERNVDRQDVLRRNSHRQQNQQHHQLEQAATAIASTVDQRQALIGQRMGQPGLGNRHRKGTQQRIAQSNIGALAQARLEGTQRGLQPQPAQQTAGQRSNDQRDNHMHPAQAQNQHHGYRRHHSIHCGLSQKTGVGTDSAPRRPRTLTHSPGPVKSR